MKGLQQKNVNVVELGCFHPDVAAHEETRIASSITCDEATKMLEDLSTQNIPAYAWIDGGLYVGPIIFAWNFLYVQARVREKKAAKLID